LAPSKEKQPPALAGSKQHHEILSGEELVMGMMRSNKISIQEIYQSYVDFCVSVGHRAPSFQMWRLSAK
jgi:hypothetical protein